MVIHNRRPEGIVSSSCTKSFPEPALAKDSGEKQYPYCGESSKGCQGVKPPHRCDFFGLDQKESRNCGSLPADMPAHSRFRLTCPHTPASGWYKKGPHYWRPSNLWWSEGDLNPRRTDFQSVALPTELPDQECVELEFLARPYILAAHLIHCKNFFRQEQQRPDS